MEVAENRWSGSRGGTPPAARFTLPDDYGKVGTTSLNRIKKFLGILISFAWNRSEWLSALILVTCWLANVY